MDEQEQKGNESDNGASKEREEAVKKEDLSFKALLDQFYLKRSLPKVERDRLS